MEKTYKCVVCGNKFISTSNRGARFCSKECRNEYIRKQKSDKMSDAQSILVYMKGRIEGAAPFCQDETVTDLLGKLLNGVNTLIEIMEEL